MFEVVILERLAVRLEICRPHYVVLVSQGILPKLHPLVGRTLEVG